MQTKLSTHVKDFTHKNLAFPLIPWCSANRIQFSQSLIDYLEKWAHI